MQGERGTFMNYDVNGDEDISSVHTCELASEANEDYVCVCGKQFHTFTSFSE